MMKTVYFNNAGAGNLRHNQSQNIQLLWATGHKGDVIFRDGNNVANANADFNQVQDSTGTSRLNINNKGGIQLGGIGAVIDSTKENGAQDTLFVYVGGGRVFCLPLAP